MLRVLRRVATVVVFWSYVWLFLSTAAPLLHPDGDASRQQPSSDQQQHIDQPVGAIDGFLSWFFKDAITTYTLVLTVATGALWRETRRSAIRGEAAQRALERPQIFVSVGAPGLAENNRAMTVDFGNDFELIVSNYGRTVASITEMRLTFDHRIGRQNTDVPPPINPAIREGEGWDELPTGIISAPDRPFRPTRALFHILDQDVWSADVVDVHVWCIGWVRYIDVFNHRYITGFCFAFDRAGGRWVARGNNRDYNYSREET